MRFSTSLWTSARWICTQSLTPAGRTDWLPVGTPARGGLALGRDLVGVVEVQVHPQRVVASQGLAELVVHALRKEHGHARPDAHDLDVGDLAQAAPDAVEQLRGPGERGAAGP